MPGDNRKRNPAIFSVETCLPLLLEVSTERLSFEAPAMKTFFKGRLGGPGVEQLPLSWVVVLREVKSGMVLPGGSLLLPLSMSLPFCLCLS